MQKALTKNTQRVGPKNEQHTAFGDFVQRRGQGLDRRPEKSCSGRKRIKTPGV